MVVISSKGNSSRLPANILDVFMWQGKHARPSTRQVIPDPNIFIYLILKRGNFWSAHNRHME